MRELPRPLAIAAPAMLAMLAMFAALAVAGALAPSVVMAQQPTPRQAAPIVIRGEVPTPQVVTVRPRQVPSFSRRVIAPQPSEISAASTLGQGYLVVPRRELGGAPRDSLRAPEAPVARGEQAPVIAPAGAAASAPVSDATQREIDAIRRELERRRARLDTIEAEIRRIGRPDSSRRTSPLVPSDSTRAPADTSGRPPR